MRGDSVDYRIWTALESISVQKRSNLLEPSVTVIMPVRNEANFIAHSLGAILNQDYPADKIEILIADGMSDDATLETISSLQGADRVHVIPNPARIQAAGLNKAIVQAKGEIIIRVDGHTVIALDYVRQCVLALTTTDAQNVGGPMNPVGITLMGKAIAAAGKSPFAVPTAFHVSQKAQYTDTVYLGAWQRELFDRVGLYDENVNINEDYELNYRIRKAGGKVYCTPAIQSQYYGRQTLGALARQYFRYGSIKTKTIKKHPASLKPRHLVAPLFVAGLAIGGVLSLVYPPVRVIWLACVLLYGFANAYFSLKAARQAEWRLFWRLPVVFLTIHLSWGWGFWVGLLKTLIEEKPV